MTIDYTDSPIGIPANDLVTAKQVADTIHKKYPEHLWAVDCSWKQGVLNIRNMMLSGQYGYRIILDKVYSASELDHMAMIGAGEILERYRIERGRADFDKLTQAGKPEL